MAEYGFTVIYEPLEAQRVRRAPPVESGTISRRSPSCASSLEEGGYQVIVPALPEIVTYGRTLDEAKEMAGDAIACHLRGLLKDNEEIPEEPFAPALLKR